MNVLGKWNTTLANTERYDSNSKERMRATRVLIHLCSSKL